MELNLVLSEKHKVERSYMSKFEDNGGYYIDGVPYMDCKITGEPVKNVSTDDRRPPSPYNRH